MLQIENHQPPVVITDTIEEEYKPKHKKPAGTLKPREDDKICKRCNCRKVNALCTIGRCLQCCSKSSRQCSYRGHIAGRKLISHPEHTQQPSHPPAFAPTITSTTTSTANLVYTYLKDLHLEQYAALLIDNGFDSMGALSSLNEELLDVLGITSLGHRSLLLYVAQQIQAI